jgi:lambda family phage portal protein
MSRVQRAFLAAMQNRLTADWVTSITSPDKELQKDLRKLRERSRDLVNNNDYAAKFVGLVAGNVIGPNGITLQSRLESGDELNDQLNQEVERAWNDWGKKKNCTVSGKLSWLDAQNLFVRTLATDGEVFVRLVRGFQNDHAFALQFIDADLVDHQFNGKYENGNEVRMGVEIDTWHRPVAYHVLTVHPADIIGTSSGRSRRERIPAEQMLHAFVTRRPDQTRGVPWMHAGMMRLQMLGAYEEAELVAARMGASQMGFLQSETGDDFTGDKQDDGTIEIEVAPGNIAQLPAGMEFQAFEPKHPTTAFEFFVKASLRGVASALGVSYSSLSGDLSDVNFSSIRSGLLEERDAWKCVQRFVTEHFCDEVLRAWLPLAMTSGALEVAMDSEELADAANWQARGWDWVDPLKDVQAASLALANRLTSVHAIVAERGGDYRDVWKQLAKEQKEAADLELTPNAHETAALAAQNDTQDNGDGGDTAQQKKKKAKTNAD